ncbi:antitermination protein [Xenorhabdus bovienii]|nr:antitermination protein [Xenorhabdus bovienii]MDE9557897.1 antitermination protein [Xenorhabdus bovienii]
MAWTRNLRRATATSARRVSILALSLASKDCKGRGTAVDRKETEIQGVPVRKTCERCSGGGYERIPASKAFKAIKSFTDDISVATWDKTIKPFYDNLIQYCKTGELEADKKLRKVTR